jgi:hypothetical protein
MRKRSYWTRLLVAPMLDMIANNVIQKYQQSTFEQL